MDIRTIMNNKKNVTVFHDYYTDVIFGIMLTQAASFSETRPLKIKTVIILFR